MKYVAVDRDTRLFQKPLTDAQLKSLSLAAFSEEPASWQLLTSGKFNTCYRVEFTHRPAVVLRVAPTSDAIIFRHEKHLLRRENLLQMELQKISKVMPVNLVIDFSHELIDRDYVFQNALPGELWDSIKSELSDDQNDYLWSRLAPIVKGIHQLPGASFGFPGSQKKHLLWGDAIIDWVQGLVLDLEFYGLDSKEARIFLDLVVCGRGYLDQVKRPTLVHGDLWPKNILVCRDGDKVDISGVLDAERGFWGEPAAEWIFSFLDIPAGFWQDYGHLPVNETTAFRNSVYEGRGALQLCLEAWRFRFDDSFARNILRQANKSLRQQLENYSFDRMEKKSEGQPSRVIARPQAVAISQY